MLTLLSFFYNLNFTEKVGCTSPSIAYRLGKETCWVQFSLDSHRRLCIPHSVWLQWLKAPTPGPFCENSQLKWRAYSRRKNSSDHFSTEPTLVQTLTSLPPFSSRTPLQSIFYWSLQKIEKIRERSALLLSSHDPFGIFRSLLLNESGPGNSAALFRKLGFVHLVTTTGIHLYAVTQGWDTFLQKIGSKCRIPLQFGIWVSRITQVLLCFSLWVLNGARLGMLRPWIVILIKEITKIMGFRWRKGAPLFVALLIDLFMEWIRTRTGFSKEGVSGRWIYALAVGGGLFWCECFSSLHVGLAIGSWLAVALYESWAFGWIAIATPVLSLITLPLFCTGAFPILVACLVFSALGITVTPLLSGFCQLLNSIFLFLLEFSFYRGNVWILPRWSLLVGGFLASLIVSRNLISSRILIVYLSLALIVVRCGSMIYSDRIKIKQSSEAQSVEQLDVGQGDAALILGPQTGMVDTGSYYSLNDEAWLHLLAERQVTEISWIALTHLDEDHSGGVIRLSRLIPIRCISTAFVELHSKRGQKYFNKIHNYGITSGDWSERCVPYPALPPPQSLSKTKKRGNENMSAIWIPIRQTGFYLSAGDASKLDEIRVGPWASHLSRKRPFPRILKISHHGSRFSTSGKFLRDVRPTHAWISAGNGNHYGHPSTQVLETLDQFRIPVLRTDRDGFLQSERTLTTKEAVLHPLQKPLLSPKKHQH